MTQLEKWVRVQVFKARSEGPCVRLVVRHVSLRAKLGSEIGSIDVPQGRLDDDWIEGTCAEIETMCQADASGMGRSVERYAILGYFGENDSHSTRMTLRVEGSDEEGDDDVESSEPATKAGSLAQLMRHNEAQAKINAQMFGSVTNFFSRTLEKLAQQNEALMVEKVQFMEVAEKLMSHEHERKLEESDREHKQKLIDRKSVV